MDTDSKKRKPISGVLLLAFLSIIAIPIISLNSFRSIILPFSFDKKWIEISTRALDSFNKQWSQLAIFEFTLNVILTIFSVMLIVIFVRRSKHLIRTLMAYYFIKIIAITVIFYLHTVIRGPVTPSITMIAQETFLSIVLTGIWLPYFLLSEQVRETF